MSDEKGECFKMIWILILAIILVVMLVMAVKVKKCRKLLIKISILLIIGLIGYLVYYFQNVYIKPNWIMQIQRADIDGFSNKVYIYSNYDVIIEYYPPELYKRMKKKLNENINLENICEYINNCEEGTNKSYKIILDSDSNNEEKIVYISSEDDNIKDFIKQLNSYMEQLK